MTSTAIIDESNHAVVTQQPERLDVVVIGGGQAGLATGYYLARQGLRFVMLDAHDRIGDSWRTRWDSLRLFTPARYDGLPGMPFPAPPNSFPTKDEMAEFLEGYADTMHLPVRTGMPVRHVAPSRNGAHRYTVTTDNEEFTTGHVVIATGAYQAPKIPDFASALDPGMVQIHSSDYLNPSQLKPGGVLVVGASNSGVEIAVEVAGNHRTVLSGNDPGQVPFRLERPIAKVAIPALWFAWNRVLTVKTPMGRKVKTKLRAHGGPLVRVKHSDLDAAGVERVKARTVGVRDGKPMLEDGRVVDVANVIWCTGFHPEYPWIEQLTYGEDGYPEQDLGVVTGAAGLYFVGLKFQRSFGSMLVGGAGRDAAHVVDHITNAMVKAK